MQWKSPLQTRIGTDERLDWVHGARGALGLNQRVCVSTIDLRDLNSVSGQLNRLFPVGGTLQDVNFQTQAVVERCGCVK